MVGLFEREDRRRYLSDDSLTSVETPEEDLSLGDEEVSLAPEQGVSPVYPPSILKEKAEIADFSLGPEYSPGLLQLEEEYAAGNEEGVAELSSQKYIDKQMKAREEIITDFFNFRPDPEAPLSEDEFEYVNTISGHYPAPNKKTVLSEQFAERYVTTSISQAAEDNPELGEVFQEQPEKADQVIDFTIKDVATGHLIRNELERLASRDDDTGKVISDFLEKFLPFKETYEIFSLSDDLQEEDLPNEAILPGQNLKDKFDYFYSLPIEAQAELLPRIADALAERNSLTAATFLSRLLSYPSTEERFENFIAALDLVDVTTGTGLAAGAAKLFALFKTAQAVGRGSLKRPIGVHKGLDALGDTARSGFLRVKDRIRRKANNLPETKDVEDIFETVPSIFNPRSVLTGSDGSLSALEQSRLLTLFQNNAIRLMGGVDDTLTVRRIRDGDIDGVLLAARDQITTTFPRLEDKIIDVKVNKSGTDTLTGNDVIEVQIGDMYGELFTNKRVAENLAKKFYELTTPFEIKQIGSRYAITTKVAVDEKSPFITSLKLGSDEVTPQTSSFVREAIRRFETPEDSFSVANRDDRRVAALGGSRLLGLTRASDEVFQSLSSKGRKRLSEFLNRERRHINENGDQGRFHDTLGEFQTQWTKDFGFSPTANEVAGYFTYRQLNDMDWTIRNFSALGGKLRRGIKDVSVSLPRGAEITFEGAPAKLDAITNETAGVLVVRGNGQHTYLRTSTPESKAEVQRLVNKGGYQMVQTSPKGESVLANTPALNKIVGSGGVDFVLAKKTTSKNLATKQIDYTPGGHIVYDNGSFVVQPRIHREVDPNTNTLVASNYRGDNALLWFRTTDEAKKYTPLINTARGLLKSKKSDELKEFLSTNLPVFSVSRFKNMFREFNDEAIFSLADDFEVTTWGKTSADYNKLSEKHKLFNDETKTSYNLYSDLPQAFLGDRSLPLLTVKEKGGYGSPILRLDKAPIIDAFPALERGLNSLVENKYLNDLKINAATRFVKEFGHLLTADRRAMERNPLPYLYNPPWKSGADLVEKKVADNYVRSTKELLNVDNKTNKILNSMKQNLADTMYRAAGQTGSEFTEPLLSRIKKPTAFLRAAAFHMTLGLLNPVQLFVQGTTFVHIAALGGLRNAAAATPAAWMMQFARQANNPEILKRLAKNSEAFGWKAKHFEEANAALQRSGFGVLGKDQALLDDAFNPDFITSKSGRFLEGTSVFFNGIERAIRHGAYATAYRKWRVVNPKAKLTDQIEREILSDAQKFSVDMTANANASWQKGWASIPTQFWSYATRMSEQMLSKRLTAGEKARVMAFYGAAFGLPVMGAIPTTYPFSEEVRDYLNKKGIQIDDTVWETFRDGLPASIMEYVTGTDFDFAGRLSPEGLGLGQVVKDLVSGDKDMFEVLIGIGGGKLGESVASVLPPVYRYMLALQGDGEAKFNVSAEEARQIVTNVSSLRQVDRLFFALNYDSYYTKDGRRVAFSNPVEGVLTALMGFQPDYVAQVYSMKRVSQDLKDFKRRVGDEIRKEYRSMLRSLERNDLSGVKNAERAINAWFQGGGFTPAERVEIDQSVMQRNKALIDLIDKQYVDGSIRDAQERALLLENLRSDRRKELQPQPQE